MKHSICPDCAELQARIDWVLKSQIPSSSDVGDSLDTAEFWFQTRPRTTIQVRPAGTQDLRIKRAILLISQVEVAVKSYWSNIGKHLPKPEIADMGTVFGMWR